MLRIATTLPMETEPEVAAVWRRRRKGPVRFCVQAGGHAASSPNSRNFNRRTLSSFQSQGSRDACVYHAFGSFSDVRQNARIKMCQNELRIGELGTPRPYTIGGAGKHCRGMACHALPERHAFVDGCSTGTVQKFQNELSANGTHENVKTNSRVKRQRKKCQNELPLPTCL